MTFFNIFFEPNNVLIMKPLECRSRVADSKFIFRNFHFFPTQFHPQIFQLTWQGSVYGLKDHFIGYRAVLFCICFDTIGANYHGRRLSTLELHRHQLTFPPLRHPFFFKSSISWNHPTVYAAIFIYAANHYRVWRRCIWKRSASATTRGVLEKPQSALTWPVCSRKWT